VGLPGAGGTLRRAVTVLLALTLVTVPQALAGTSGGQDGPAIDWSPGPVVLANDEIRFTTSADADELVWRFPDGSQATGASATHAFDEPGEETVELAAVRDGERSTTRATVPVQGSYRQDQIVKEQVFIEASGRMDLEAEHAGEQYASTSDAAPEDTPLANDDILIDATIYHPDPDVAEGPFPAMMATHGWGGHKSQYEGYGGSFAEEGVGAYAQEGYVGVVYNTRGTANSTGYQRAYDPQQEMQDARDLLTWLADNDAHDGDVYSGHGMRSNTSVDFQVELDGPGDPHAGMFGQSNGGITTLLLAGQDDRLDAAAPGGVYHNLTFSMLPNGVPKSVLIAGIAAGAAANVGVEQLQRGHTEAFATNPGLWGTVDTEIPSWMVQGFTGAETDVRQDFRDRSPMTYNDAIDVPTFLSHGWMDQFFEPPNPLHNYQQLAENPHFSQLEEPERERQLKLVMQPMGHDFYEHKVQDMRVPWFDHFLKGHDLDDTYHGVVDRYNGDNPGDVIEKPAATYSHVVDQPPILFHEDHPDDERCVSMGVPQGCSHPGTEYAWYDRASLEGWIADSPDHWQDPYTGFHYRAYDDAIWTQDSPERFHLRADNGLSREAPSQSLLAQPDRGDVIANVPGPGWTTWNPASDFQGTPWEQLDHAPAATVSYESPPLAEDLTAIGHGEANLDVVVSANGPLDSGTGDVHFVVKVWDETPEGERELVTRGYQAIGLEDRAEDPSAEIAREVTVPLYSMDRVIPENHRLVVQVTHSDMTYVAPSLVPHTTLIQHTPENPSWVDLPTRTAAELAEAASPVAG